MAAEDVGSADAPADAPGDGGGVPAAATAAAAPDAEGKAKGEPKEDRAVEVRLAGLSDVGLVREHNEDSFLVLRLDDGARDPAALGRHPLGTRGTLLAVCDGMGGAAAGEVASGMAVDALAEDLTGERQLEAEANPDDDEKTALARRLRAAARDANGRIFAEARDNLARAGMGTTMTAVHLWSGWALIAQVGDSRAYLWRQGAFVQMTRDQSLVNQLVESGQITPEQAKFFEHSNVILQALGVQEDVDVQLSRVELRRGDRLLVCSDGLVGVVSDEEIGAIVGSIDEPAEAARLLVEMANGAGGPDNITVIVAHLDGLPDPKPDDVPVYAAWQIDPAPPIDEGETTASGRNPTATATAQHRPVALATAAPTAADPLRPASELLSMAVIVGLILGSIATGLLLHRQRVPCVVTAARAAGQALFVDGRDSGVRLDGDGELRLRLKPGRHLVTLGGEAARRGAGHGGPARVVDVAADRACHVSFDGDASTGTPP